ncbi:MAG: capsid assembly scaffolding protein Gp46 family protein [Culicoidibacterales bacterium]
MDIEKIKMNLQLLADGQEPEGGQAPDGDGTETETIEIPDEHKEAFDKLLQAELAKKQAEMDKAFAKQKAKAKADAENAAKEAERLAKLTEDERKTEEFKTKLADLEKREAELNRRSMEAEIKNQLSIAGLPDLFLETVYSDDADEAKSKIEALKEKYEADLSARVQAEVEAKFAGQKGPNVNTETSNGFRKGSFSFTPL